MPRKRNNHYLRTFSGSFSLAACAFLLLFSASLFAQQATDKPAKLFSTNDTLNVTMTAPWRDIVRNERNQDPYPATITFTDELGNTNTFDMTAARRGITRQRVCSYPPIRLRFEKETVKGSTFRGQKSLKMVTHCEKSKRFEQYFILEMLAYRMYNLMTDYSFRVRPLNVTYVDSKTGKTNEGRFAFLIEDDSDVAKRHDMKKLDFPKIKVTQLEPELTSKFALFQYMIANVDWAALSGPDPKKCCHNTKLIGPEPFEPKDRIYPIPYDFDSAGLIDAHYAAPPNGLPIGKVTQRLYRGYCLFNPTLEEARQEFIAKEAEIYALINNENRLTSSTQKKATKYIGRFFDTIKDQKDFDKQIIARCRK